MVFKKLFFFVFFISIYSHVFAQQSLDGVYYDWSVFVLDDLGSEKQCYMVAFPKNSIGNFKKKREPYILITKYQDRQTEEVSLYAGFEYKIASDVYISIDGKQFILFTKGDIAWAKSKKDDKTIIETLLKAYKLKIRAESVHTEYVVDEYSLKGMSRAYKRIKELCKPINI